MPYYSTDPFFRERRSLRPQEAVPLAVAIELAELVTEACQWFHDPRHLFLGDVGAPSLSDEVVDEVCFALQHQLDREGQSRTRGAPCSRHNVAHTSWYHLMELPMARRRALVERVWAIRERSKVEVRVWTDEPGSVPPPEPRPAVTWDYPWP